MSETLTRENIADFSKRIEAEGMRGCYDGDEAAVFFEACEWLARAANKLRPKGSTNEPI